MKQTSKLAMLALTIVAPLLGCTNADEPEAEASSSDELVVEACCSNTQPGVLPLVRFDGSRSLAVTTPAGDAADVYYPTDRFGRILQQLGVRHAVVVLLQGAQTDKSAYARFAGLVARHGFVVIVPNHARAFPPGAPPSLFTEESVITDGLAAVHAETLKPQSPLAGRLDETRLAVVGHSFGGVAAVLGVAGSCAPPFCTPGTYVRPAALKAAVVYGTNYTAGEPRAALPVDTSAAPIAMLQGTVDGRSLPALGELTYAELEAPKAFIEIEGANHFGITDTNAPAGAIPDSSAASISQTDAVERIATWSAIFLRATVNHDLVARAYLRSNGTATVAVASTP